MNDHQFLRRETRIACFLMCIPKVQRSHFLCFEEVFLASFAKLTFVISVILDVTEKLR